MILRRTGRLAALLLLCATAACGSAPATSIPSTAAPVAVSTSAVSPETELPTPTTSTTSATDDHPSPTPEPPLAARVNGEPIYLAEYERELGRYEAGLAGQGIDPSSPEGQDNVAQHRDWILNVMIEQLLTERAAAAEGIVVTDEQVDAYMQEMATESGGAEAFAAKLAEWGQNEEDAWREVRGQLIGMRMTQRIIDSVPTTAEHVHARHILVDTGEEAERILAQLQASADFAMLAKAYSQDTSTRENGGDLGFFPRGILVAPEVEEVAFALQPGQFSGVVYSVLGYHIVQVVERDPARQISQENLSLLQEEAVQSWVERLWAQAEVERFVETAP